MKVTLDDVPPLPELPTFDGPRQIMLDFVKAGAMPGTACIVAGIGDTWKADAEFARAVNVAHAYVKARAEVAAHKMVTSGASVPSGLSFYLQAVCEWRTKYGEDGFAQELNIKVQEVDGYSPEGEEGKYPKVPIRKNADMGASPSKQTA